MSNPRATDPVARPLDALAAALVVALCLSWGLNQVAIKLTLPDIPPLIQATIRSFGASRHHAVVGCPPRAAAEARRHAAARRRRRRPAAWNSC